MNLSYFLIFPWDHSKFSTHTHYLEPMARSHWDNPSNQVTFMNNLLTKQNIPWSLLTTKVLQEHGGAGLLKKYGSSLSKLLANVFPEYRTKCKELVVKVMKEKNLSKPEEVLHVPIEYPNISTKVMEIEKSTRNEFSF